MPRILKNFWRPNADDYILQPAEELAVGKPPQAPGLEEPAQEAAEAEAPPREPQQAPHPLTPEEDPVHFARIQAAAILKDAQAEAEAYMARERQAFEAQLEEERKAGREEGYARGFSEGMADAMAEAKLQREKLAEEQIKAVKDFLESAAHIRNRILDDSREELKDLALAIAEKVIRVSLKNSDDILLRMVDAATDTHKRCEWAHIYVADCDLKGKAYTVPELTAALGHISDRVRVIPMADDESGTCIIELPDVILDASVSTQLGNIKEVLSSTGLDER